MNTPTNEQIARNENLWNEYFNVEAHPDNEFNSLTFDERLAMLNKAYQDDSEA